MPAIAQFDACHWALLRSLVVGWGAKPGAMKRCRSSGVRGVGASAFVATGSRPDVILLAVRWYLRFGLSYRDLEEFLAERGIEVDHVSLYR
jgi:hypothetical protein